MSGVLFLLVCYITALICAGIRDDGPVTIVVGSIKLFLTLVAGMVSFCALIEGVTWMFG